MSSYFAISPLLVDQSSNEDKEKMKELSSKYLTAIKKLKQKGTTLQENLKKSKSEKENLLKKIENLEQEIKEQEQTARLKNFFKPMSIFSK